jgi:hypothetical protein
MYSRDLVVMGQECAAILRIGKPLWIAGVDGTDARGAAVGSCGGRRSTARARCRAQIDGAMFGAIFQETDCYSTATSYNEVGERALLSL